MDENNYPITIWKNKQNGSVAKFIWIEGSDLSKYNPFTQCYGVCFNSDGQILIQRYQTYDWCLPGGTVEKGETPEETLRREFLEEVDATLKNIILLGGQKVEFQNGDNPDTKRGVNNFYQLRFYCELDELLPQTPDPDKGELRERKFVDPDKITKYFDWGDTGKAIFGKATELYKIFHYHEDTKKRVEGERHAGIVIKDDKILLIHRIKNGHEYFVIPGGHRRVEDSGEQTVEREIQEETNITTKCNKLITHKEGEFYYLCDWVRGEKPELVGEEKVKNSPENFYEPMWVNVKEINSLNILPEFLKSWLLENISNIQQVEPSIRHL